MKYTIQYTLTRSSYDSVQVHPPAMSILCGGVRKVRDWELLNMTVGNVAGNPMVFVLWKRQVILEGDT